MRPLRLLLDGFGSYREPAEADFTGVDFFALVGPTGSGKSTVIDGLCFALYGTVPRWGKENVIAQALAPAANACRVALVFEAAGKRYAAVRALTRNARGQVNTKEARLELLDSSVPPDAPLNDLLEANIEHLAEGPDQVKAAVAGILGLTYEHFTQSVLLPQGRFSEFLHAKAADRQDLLVELLAFGVYNAVGVKARERAKLAAELAQRDKDAAARISGATAEAEAAATARVRSLDGLAGSVRARLVTLGELKAAQTEAAARSSALRIEAGLLGGVRTPDDVPGLAQRISEADQLVRRRRDERDRSEALELEARAAREALPDKAGLERLRDAYAQQRELTAQLQQAEQALASRRDAATARQAALEAAEEALEQARTAYSAAERSHAAVAIAQDLVVGAECPVCSQPVTALPHHPVPADLARAKTTGEKCRQAERKARTELDQAEKEAAAAAGAVENLTLQLQNYAGRLSEAMEESQVRDLLDAVAVADERIAKASPAAQAARSALNSAEQERAGLQAGEQRALAGLSAARDLLVHLGAPGVDGADLAAAWATLTTWARDQHRERVAHLGEVDLAAGAASAKLADAEAELRVLLSEHDIDLADVTRAEVEVATRAERAAQELARVRANRKQADEIAVQLAAHAEEEKVAAMLGRLLRASSFERWLCGEALDSLVAEASQTLMELSGGQYQLDRDERNDLVVIDFSDAGARRPVHTLSGGETFQASLALALALSRQVIGLSAGMRDLNSMFLDEGFGTLDEDTLEVVGSTLERLSTDSDRMIGIITHVPALAERAPVRFVVSRAGTTSTLRKETVA
jgi:exonuclease SbcC